MFADAITTVATTTSCGFDWQYLFTVFGIMAVAAFISIITIGFFYMWFTIGEINERTRDILSTVVDDNDNEETPKKKE